MRENDTLAIIARVTGGFVDVSVIGSAKMLHPARMSAMWAAGAAIEYSRERQVWP